MYRNILIFLLITILAILTLVKMVVSDTLIKNTKQSGRVMKTIQPSGIKMCAKYCFCENRCQSFNFEQETLSCEMLPTEDPSLYINTKGYLHSNITEWSRDLAGKCGVNHCSVEERYVPLRNGGVTCIKIGCVGIQYTYDNTTDLCYHVYQDLKTWTDASEYCQNEGGRLIVLDTEEKMINFPPAEHKNYRVSIGLSDSETEGTFKWVTGSILSSIHHKFRTGQPNDVDNGYPGMSADCVNYNGDYWYDDYCQRERRYACERPDLSLK